MEESKNTYDRRTLKTRKAIKDALCELLVEKELHKVTVKEITDKADINRGTFYKHYLDVFDLYDKMEHDILIDLGMLVLELESLRSEQFFKHLIDYIDDNRPEFRMMFSPNSTCKLRDRFNRILEGLFRQLEAEEIEANISDITLRYHTNYRSRGCTAVIGLWARGNFVEPKEFIIKNLCALDSNTKSFILKNK
ncbi:MAG: TetR/AcrR family transcriptional regulator [Clostridiales bacterium]|nr:TetR/AcrR family transcriptional regulator [Clostridiales bacterium]